jgi:hypothetical protein
MPRSTSQKTKVDRLTCQCAISYHTEQLDDGRVIAVLDEELPSALEMCHGRCQRCGLPFQIDFPNETE